jgi:hypothetical protein
MESLSSGSITFRSAVREDRVSVVPSRLPQEQDLLSKPIRRRSTGVASPGLRAEI